MRRYSPKPTPREFTTKSAGQYLTRKSRGAKFIGRDIVYTPEFTKYVSKHRTQKELRNALTARAEYVYAKGKPKAPTHMSRVAKIEYKQALKEYAIRKAELSQAINDENSSNMRIARRLSSYENARMALRDNSGYWENRAVGRLVGILSNTPEANYIEMSMGDAKNFLNAVESFSKDYNDFYKYYEQMVIANYGSDALVSAVMSIGESINDMLESNDIEKDMINDAKTIVNILGRYGLL